MDRFDEMTGETWDRVTGAKLYYKLKHTARWDAHGSKASVQQRRVSLASGNDARPLARATRFVQIFPSAAGLGLMDHPLISRCGFQDASAHSQLRRWAVCYT